MVYEALIVIGGLFIGWLLAKLTKEELKPGEKWLKLLCNIVLGVLVFFILYAYSDWKLIIGVVIGLVIGLFVFNPYLYFGALGVMTYYGYDWKIFSILAFIYSLGYISLYHYKTSWKFLLFNICLFLFPYLFLLQKANIPWLWYGIAIGGVIHVVKENYSRD